MNRKDTWAYLGRRHRKPVIHADDWGVEIGSKIPLGLCACLRHLWVADRISLKTELKMLDDLRRYGPKKEDGLEAFLWKTTKAGATWRAKFCERMVERIEAGETDE